ncbi:beta-phosphoglucomutase family hydrolase [Nakamurella sp. UYEF19]|uniref:HAD family hydrolase n=1 Tax=Nakamurella sp. UYEF19 TaxID=1756392 RepID=UPI003399B41C
MSASAPHHPESRQRCTVGSAPHSPLGLPAGAQACLFDLDGVLTDTARLHAAAWKEMFDKYLKARAEKEGQPFVAFDDVGDYDTYVDGKSRADGTRSFLRSRGIDMPIGASTDGVQEPTITGLGAAKNAMLLRRIRRDGVNPYPGSGRYVRAVRSAGLRTAVVSSSANYAEVLTAAGIADLFDTRIDGVTAQEQQLDGKPAPETYLAAATVLGVDPGGAAVFEDALSGVAAGRAGGFGFVVGVDRVGQGEELRAHGADRVVTDLGQLLTPVGPG